MEVKAGYKQTEVGVIPEDWDVCPVGQKGEVVTGKALAVNGPGKQRPYLRTKNVFDGRIAIDDVLTMPMTDDQFMQFGLRHGDVLLNEGQSLELVGRCAIYQGEYPEPCAIQNQLIRFRARVGVSGIFASYVFRYCQQSGVFARIALQTTSIAHLGGSRFQRLRLAWPKSETEQRAIAEALSDVDGLLGGLDRLITKKRDLKQAAMQQLLTGQTRLPGFHGEWVKARYKQTEVGVIPEDWNVSQLGALADMSSGTTPARALHERYFRNGSIAWVKTLDLTNADIPDTSEHVTELALKETSLRVYPVGTVLVAMYGGFQQIGRTGLLRIPAAVNQAITAIQPKPEKLVSEYLLEVLNHRVAHWKAVASSSRKDPNISSRDIRNFPIAIPKSSEQTAIAAVLSDMDAELAALEQRRAKTRALKQAMMQELLTGRTRLV